MMKLVGEGFDILKITPDVIRYMMVSLPTISEGILLKTAEDVISYKGKEADDLTERDKKIIVFELIGAGFSSGAFEDSERKLLEHICQLLKVDSEYIEEFTEVMGRLAAVNKEVADLINE
ncbi:hypothetical protein D0T90_09150 [Neisseria animalis]|uniref:TerB family tellurite resistance protein n=2 Tax=Neisseria animalis TaxID=492 RepID=A0A5P3MV10_NEIAN|nr:hypothetical protein D0T90_09150 [Neisseria animalis]